MHKTLADMTAEERANCVGMWCDVVGFTRPTPIVEMWGEEVELLVHDNLRGHITTTYELEHVTPRFDLPRAWTPDGEPELAQALAEETYFYGVQVWMGGRWIMMLTRDHGTGITHRGKWFEHKHEAEEYVAKWNHDTPTRIVRQRRSPVEVINE